MNPRTELTAAELRKVRNIEDGPGAYAARMRCRAIGFERDRAERGVMIDDVIEPWGKVAMITWTGGERYYFFVKNHVVSMIPASTVEVRHESRIHH